jgi:hypothetical protein
MTWSRRHVGLAAVCAIYLTVLGFLAGLATERIRADRARDVVRRAQDARQREAREHAIRLELQHQAQTTR